MFGVGYQRRRDASIRRWSEAADLSRILSQTDRAATMVRQLLQLTRYEKIPYPGGAPMIDLERATQAADAVASPVRRQGTSASA